MNKHRPTILFFLLLVVLNFAVIGWLTNHRFDSIVIHHTASATDNLASVRALHAREHGWLEAGYHLILSNGGTEVPFGYLEATKRYRYLSYSLATKNVRCNLTGVHFCLVGNFSQRPVPDNLKSAMAQAVSLLQERFAIPDDQILFHRDCSASECPGLLITKHDFLTWVKTRARDCPPEIQEQ